MMLKKILLAIINPWKWNKIYEQVSTLLNNIIEYRDFSFNPNSRGYWDKRLSMYDNFWRNENYCHILDLLPQDKEFSLLDIGCAMGDGCELLQEKFPKAKITGVDISSVGIEKAKQKTKSVQYFVLDILKHPIPKKYDYITMIETLEHFDNPFAVVDKCLKYVRQSLIISAPYYNQKHYSEKMANLSEHRYNFDEKTFTNYNCRVAKITEFVKVTEARCIIYEIRP
jgi:2-polyprenyl-3-methyl-5-hydroxy-6-metoxy-1,4-benzoquinol methylase